MLVFTNSLIVLILKFMRFKNIENKNTFRFFNYKWKKVPSWGIQTERIYRKWYLKRYGFKSQVDLKKFLKNKKILEAGCGLARDSKFFRELSKNSSIYACDQSDIALKNSKKIHKNLNINFFKQDITKKFEEKDFDLISCDQVLHHTPNPGAVLKNFNKILNKGGYLFIFVCAKKNIYRDFCDDFLMSYFSKKSPDKLWSFAKECTKFAKTLYNLKSKKINFKGKKYKNIQEYIHYNLFRFWYNPSIPFNLSVSSNYDWFSNNPRYSQLQILNIIKKNLKGYKILNYYKDDASISFKLQKYI